MGGPGQPMPGRMMGGAPPTGSMPPMMGPRHPGAPNGMCEYAIRTRLPDPTQPESVCVGVSHSQTSVFSVLRPWPLACTG